MVTPVYKRPLGASGMKGVRDNHNHNHNNKTQHDRGRGGGDNCGIYDAGGLAIVTVIRQGKKVG